MKPWVAYTLTGAAAVSMGVIASRMFGGGDKERETGGTKLNRPMTNAEIIERQRNIKPIFPLQDPNREARRKAWQEAQDAAIELAPGVREIINPTSGQKIVQTTAAGANCESLVWDGRCGNPTGRTAEFNACRDRVLRECAKGYI
jgi:hypothetical protein